MSKEKPIPVVFKADGKDIHAMDIVNNAYNELTKLPEFPKSLEGIIIFWKLKKVKKPTIFQEAYIDMDWRTEKFEEVNFTLMQEQGWTEYKPKDN